MNKWVFNEVERQFVDIDRKTALARYMELLSLDAEETKQPFNAELYAQFSLKLMMDKGADMHE